MPKIDKYINLTITPEQFLRACTPDELKELDLLLGSREYQFKMHQEEFTEKAKANNPPGYIEGFKADGLNPKTNK